MCQSKNEGFARSPHADRERSRQAHTQKDRKPDVRFHAHGCGMFMPRTNDPEKMTTGEPRE